MRYRVTFEQVMSTWYVTVKYWEPDGEEFWKSTGHYTIPVDPVHPVDLSLMLRELMGHVG